MTNSQRNAKFTIELSTVADILDAVAKLVKPGECGKFIANMEAHAAQLRNYAMLRPYFKPSRE